MSKLVKVLLGVMWACVAGYWVAFGIGGVYSKVWWLSIILVVGIQAFLGGVILSRRIK